ncbi:MAG: tRNA lysidine(34) synthetase TilS [Thermoanaerobaculia bacterium]
MRGRLRVIDAAIRRFFVKFQLDPCRIVAAASGGADSTALLLALADLRAEGFEIEAAHVNHHLRGEESVADEAFVRDLCRDLGVALHVADGTLDPDRVRQRGIEAAAREVRYARLSDIRVQTGSRLVATAHQKNDQAETVLMRLVTGSGIAGLRGVHPMREDGFIRPLLDVTRDRIDAYLHERNIVPRHDRSNDDPRFLRNRIRGVVRQLGAVDNLAAIAEQARQQWPILERAIDEAERAHVIITADETRFLSWPDDRWLRQALLHRHIRRLDPAARDVSARDLERLAAEAGNIRRVSVTKRLELIRREHVLVLRKPPQPVGEFEVELTLDAPAFIPELGITVRLSRGTRPTFQLPRNSAPRFLLRNRRPGDRFQPLGMQHSKKLKDFLIDRKIAVDFRDRLPLLLWNNEIVWVAGVEVSERFRITGAEADRYEVWLDEVSLEEEPVADHDRDPSPVRS